MTHHTVFFDSLLGRCIGHLADKFFGFLGLFRKPRLRPKEREWMLWVGDGMAPAGPHLIGSPVDYHGRKGTVVATTLLKILVEWEPT